MAVRRPGLGCGMFPESLADSAGLSLVSDGFLDVPLFWQCWKPDTRAVNRITEAVLAASAQHLRR